MSALASRDLSGGDIVAALAAGWHTFRSMPVASIAYASVFALIGLLLLVSLGQLGMSPMALPLMGGFMLVGPALLCGFFELANCPGQGRTARSWDAFAAFRRAPGGLWAVAIFCAFLFLIWMTDAALLYAFMIGGEHQTYQFPWLIDLQGHVIAFELWALLMGSVLAFIIFAVSAFSVPLLYERRATFVQAVHASVRAVLKNFLVCICWGLLLSAATLLAILVLPLLMVVLPILAYASFSLYRHLFPLSMEARP